MHIHERLLLLGLEEKSGLPYSQLRPIFALALAAAAIADLELLGSLKFGEDALVVLDNATTDVPVLDRVLETLNKDKRACDIDKAGRRLLAAVTLTELSGAGLVSRGVVALEQSTFAFIFKKNRYIIKDRESVGAVHDSLPRAIAGEDLDPHTRVALALADTLGLLTILAARKGIDLPAQLADDLADGSTVGAVRVLKAAIARTRIGVTPQV